MFPLLLTIIVKLEEKKGKDTAVYLLKTLQYKIKS